MRFFVLALSGFPGRPSIVLPLKNMPVACFRQKKAPIFRSRLMCWRYLSSRAVTSQVLSAQMSLTSVFGMGTGGPSSQSTPTMEELWILRLFRWPVRFQLLHTITAFPVCQEEFFKISKFFISPNRSSETEKTSKLLAWRFLWLPLLDLNQRPAD